MTWTAVAVAGGAIGGALITKMGSQGAANTQANAEIEAAQIQQQMYEQNVKNESPFMQAGYQATNSLDYLLGDIDPKRGELIQKERALTGLPMGYLTKPFSMTQRQLENLPGYQFQLRQGDLGVQAQGAATGSALGGATLKDLSAYNQGLASSYYQNYYNMYQQQQNNIFNRYSAMAGLGQNAAAQVGNNGAQLGTGVAQAIAAAGGAQAAGQMGAANAFAGAASSIPLYMMMSNMNNNSSTGNTYLGNPNNPGGP